MDELEKTESGESERSVGLSENKRLLIGAIRFVAAALRSLFNVAFAFACGVLVSWMVRPGLRCWAFALGSVLAWIAGLGLRLPEYDDDLIPGLVVDVGIVVGFVMGLGLFTTAMRFVR